MNLKIIMTLLLALAFAMQAFAQEEESKVWCAVKDKRTADDCFSRLGEELGSENDTNAVLVTSRKDAKTRLIELLEFNGGKKPADLRAIANATYVAVIVQNHDEDNLFYYVVSKGDRVKPRQIGDRLSFVDHQYDVCPSFEGQTPDVPAKFRLVRNLLLGMDPKKTVTGTVWVEDIKCE